MAKKQKNNWMLVFSALILLFVLMMFLLVLTRNNLFVLEKKEIPARLIISNHTAFNITKGSDVLHLGTIKQGNMAERKIIADNTYPFPITYEFESTGNISKFLVFPEEVYLDVQQTLEIPFKTEIIPQGTAWGEYSGKILVTVKRFFGGLS
jgi:hypothetical protein